MIFPGVEEPELTMLRKDNLIDNLQSNFIAMEQRNKQKFPRPEQGTPLIWEI